ncbi:eukaryotic translation initiation factor 4E1-like [Neocloeon triangulifer]|uniref:eukaryotic translation initiation factor 4E1-like n=1 Tax=Neocloeon triangulifer TaxID=2078957 RepID=UPI00286EED2A|nr:eukaryotic translation initiation factor 4E1-like [Neocloeon triangulifer]
MIKHPLQNSWTLWEHLNVRTKSWEENLVEIFSIETVEDFWTMVNHITPASKLKIGTGYLLFKKGIPPMWEHPANKNGGRWFVSFEKKKRRLELLTIAGLK